MHFSITQANPDFLILSTGSHNRVVLENVKTFFGKTYLKDYCNTAKQLLSGLTVINQYGKFYKSLFWDSL
jgi:hypothetical protein